MLYLETRFCITIFQFFHCGICLLHVPMLSSLLDSVDSVISRFFIIAPHQCELPVCQHHFSPGNCAEAIHKYVCLVDVSRRRFRRTAFPSFAFQSDRSNVSKHCILLIFIMRLVDIGVSISLLPYHELKSVATSNVKNTRRTAFFTAEDTF